jgi:hypothetical protein
MFILMLLVCVVVALVGSRLAGFAPKSTALLVAGAAAVYTLDVFIITRLGSLA